jgi:hypothetical protein
MTGRTGTVLLVLAAAFSACSGGDGGREATGDGGGSPPGDPWDIGTDVGEHFGPFPNILGVWPGTPDQPASHGWIAIVLPPANPLDAFNAVVDDAENSGFTATVRHGGGCWQQWSREEVPFGENGEEWDGHEFGGEEPFEAQLPVGAQVTGVACEVVVSRGSDRVDISMRADVHDASPRFPARTAIVLRSRTTDAPTEEFKRQEIDLDLPTTPPPLTDQEMSYFGFADLNSDFEGGIFHLQTQDEQGCRAAVLRDVGTPTEAAARAVAASQSAEFFDGQPSLTNVRDLEASVVAFKVPAGGPAIYISAVETGDGADLLVCRADE